MKSEIRFGERVFFLVLTVVSGPILLLAGILGRGTLHYLRVQYLAVGGVLTVLGMIVLRGLWNINQEDKIFTGIQLLVEEGEQDAMG